MSLLHQIALTQVPQVGAVTAKMLVSYCGSAEAVFHAKKSELIKIPGIGLTVVEHLRRADALALAEREVDFLERHKIEAIFYTDERYPFRLRQCYDCPALLFFKGSSPQLLTAPRIVAVVGTRQPTEQGKALCEEIIEGLQPYNVVIVSGLAFGIDVAAHRKASSLDIPNVGVLGHGLGSIYPSAHRSTALRMIENGGLLSEYISSTKPDRDHFPMRNRIIAGLCDALIVVETGVSGGSVISAHLANQYEREVFAVPGRVRDAKSIGCNRLIKNNEARLLESATDLAEIMGWQENGQSRSIQAQLFFDLTPREQNLLDIIRQHPEIAVDQLSIAAQWSPGELAAVILSLEFKGAVRTLPGKRYIVSG